ncbi:MAG TPA: YkgJ family cysteine cluster protein [Phycisphaerae bacterium]|nr:YkgJ family cysteine cluster protein [Phycisphaerae bacterium]HRW51835.1 YkgJ family cysteine cluster protein [Phycisphaerae bacterium]
MLEAPTQLHIAGLSIALFDATRVLDDLRALYADFAERTNAFRADARNPHLCAAGCSACCKKGAVFAVTLVEALELSLAIHALPTSVRDNASAAARELVPEQHRVFAGAEGPADQPGRREEPMFSRRIGALNRELGPACPLLADDLCSVYAARPLLCRAYGFPVDAYAVRADGAITFRSLCVLYEGKQLVDYVRAETIRTQLEELSDRLAGNRSVGRFTSIEAIVARID